MYLDSKEGRFHGAAIDPQHVKYSAEKMTAIAYGIRHGKPIVKTSKVAANTDYKRVKLMYLYESFLACLSSFM